MQQKAARSLHTHRRKARAGNRGTGSENTARPSSRQLVRRRRLLGRLTTRLDAAGALTDGSAGGDSTDGSRERARARPLVSSRSSPSSGTAVIRPRSVRSGRRSPSRRTTRRARAFTDADPGAVRSSRASRSGLTSARCPTEQSRPARAQPRRASVRDRETPSRASGSRVCTQCSSRIFESRLDAFVAHRRGDRPTRSGFVDARCAARDMSHPTHGGTINGCDRTTWSGGSVGVDGRGGRPTLGDFSGSRLRARRSR